MVIIKADNSNRNRPFRAELSCCVSVVSLFQGQANTNSPATVHRKTQTKNLDLRALKVRVKHQVVLINWYLTPACLWIVGETPLRLRHGRMDYSTVTWGATRGDDAPPVLVAQWQKCFFCFLIKASFWGEIEPGGRLNNKVKARPLWFVNFTSTFLCVLGAIHL